MGLNKEALQAAGAFTGGPVAKEITWESGGQEHTATVYVRPLSYHSAMSDILAVHGHGDAGAGRIAKCICDEKGQPIFTASDITGLHEDGTPVMWTDPDTGEEMQRGAICESLALALLAVISEASGLGKTRASKS